MNCSELNCGKHTFCISLCELTVIGDENEKHVSMKRLGLVNDGKMTENTHLRLLNRHILHTEKIV